MHLAAPQAQIAVISHRLADDPKTIEDPHIVPPRSFPRRNLGDDALEAITIRHFIAEFEGRILGGFHRPIPLLRKVFNGKRPPRDCESYLAPLVGDRL